MRESVHCFLSTHDDAHYAPCLGDPDDSPFDTLPHTICAYHSPEDRQLAADFMDRLDEKQRKKLQIMRDCLQLYDTLKAAFDEWYVRQMMIDDEEYTRLWSSKGLYSGVPREDVSAMAWSNKNDPYGVIPLFLEKLHHKGFHTKIVVHPALFDKKTRKFEPGTILSIIIINCLPPK